MASLDDTKSNNNVKQQDAATAEEEADDTVSATAAAAVASSAPSCHGDPNFAIVCAFLQKFAGKLNITYPDFQELQLMLENTDERMCDGKRRIESEMESVLIQ